MLLSQLVVQESDSKTKKHQVVSEGLLSRRQLAAMTARVVRPRAFPSCLFVHTGGPPPALA